MTELYSVDHLHTKQLLQMLGCKTIKNVNVLGFLRQKPTVFKFDLLLRKINELIQKRLGKTRGGQARPVF